MIGFVQLGGSLESQSRMMRSGLRNPFYGGEPGFVECCSRGAQCRGGVVV